MSHSADALVRFGRKSVARQSFLSNSVVRTYCIFVLVEQMSALSVGELFWPKEKVIRLRNGVVSKPDIAVAVVCRKPFSENQSMSDVFIVCRLRIVKDAGPPEFLGELFGTALVFPAYGNGGGADVGAVLERYDL